MSNEKEELMTVRTADQIRLLLFITAMIGTAIAMGVAPTLWASL